MRNNSQDWSRLLKTRRIGQMEALRKLETLFSRERSPEQESKRLTRKPAPSVCRTIAFCALACLLLTSLPACVHGRQPRTEKLSPPTVQPSQLLKEVYQAAPPPPSQSLGNLEPDPVLVTARFSETPVRLFCQVLADQYGICVAVAQELDQQTVTGDFQDTPLRVCLSTVGRRLGVELIELRGLYYLGQRRPEDKAIMVRKIRRLTPEQVGSSVGGFLSQDGTFSAIPDGLIVLGDRLEVIERLSDMFDRLEKAPSVVWCIQLHVISMSDRDLLDFGLDVNPALELAAGYANLSNVTKDLTLGVVQGVRGEGGASVADASLNAVLRATRERGTMRIVADPLFTCVDGSSATITKGLRIPVRTSTITGNAGNVSNNVRFVQTGLEATASVREISDTVGRMTLKLSVSEVQSVSSELGPTTDDQGMTCETDVETGGVYLLGGLRRAKREQGAGSLLTIGQKQNKEDDVWLIFGKCYRISKGL